MGIKQDYEQALALAKQGEYKQARALLTKHDHKSTNALLAKVNKAIDESQPKASWKKRVLQGFAIVALLVVGFISWSAWYVTYGYGATELNATVACLSDYCDSDELLANHADALRTCKRSHGNVTLDNQALWRNCLDDNGVVTNKQTENKTTKARTYDNVNTNRSMV